MVWIFIWIAFAVATPIVADAKGLEVRVWVVLGILFGFFAFIVVAVLPSVKKKAPDMVGGLIVSIETHGRCHACKEIIRLDATKCAHCGSDHVPKALPVATVF